MNMNVVSTEIIFNNSYCFIKFIPSSIASTKCKNKNKNDEKYFKLAIKL